MACWTLSFTASSKPWQSTALSFSEPRHVAENLLLASQLSFITTPLSRYSALYNDTTFLRCRFKKRASSASPSFLIVNSVKKADPLKLMISGAPASGKGTQCELISKKGLDGDASSMKAFNFITKTGDLLRAEIAAGTDNGRRAKEYMEKGQLVPDEIVVMMVKQRLSQPDSKEKGWLLDGYPRSLSQAVALKEFGFHPDLFILLEVSEDTLVERVVGRRLDPVTGKIYHLKYSPPETEEIAARLTQRFDDTEEKVKLRLHTHHQNVESVLSIYEDITVKVNGTTFKEEVFSEIDSILTKYLEQKQATVGSMSV